MYIVQIYAKFNYNTFKGFQEFSSVFLRLITVTPKRGKTILAIFTEINELARCECFSTSNADIFAKYLPNICTYYVKNPPPSPLSDYAARILNK